MILFKLTSPSFAFMKDVHLPQALLYQLLNIPKISLSLVKEYHTFKRQPRKMVSHTQTIRQQIANELFECV